MNTTSNSNPIIHDIPPYIRVYKDGTVERLFATEIEPPSLDPRTGVESKDVIFEPVNNLRARIYRPRNSSPSTKLPLVIYFHGGAFFISSIADPKYHNMLNLLVKESKVILLSIDYRLAPEHPLPTAYEDSWAALKWVASHESGRGDDPWIKEYADLDRVYLAGDSAGANISHHMALKLGSEDPQHGLTTAKINGILMVQPYFWGERPIGVECENETFKSVVDQWWLFVCPSDKGCDDPWINPFVDGAPGVGRLACGRVLVCVAGNDVLRERGKLYYKKLVESDEWSGEAELFVSEGEGHVFHIMDPTSENSIELIKRCAEFLNRP